MNGEQEDFTSEHRAFAEREGYTVAATADGYVVVMPRQPRPGEKIQTFKTLAMAWEVAAIRAGRKIARDREKPRPAPIMQARYRGKKP